MNDKATILGLSTSEQLQFERDKAAAAEQHAIEAEARLAIMRDLLDSAELRADDERNNAAFWAARCAKEVAAKEFAQTIAIGGAVSIVGAIFALLIRWAWF